MSNIISSEENNSIKTIYLIITATINHLHIQFNKRHKPPVAGENLRLP